MPWELQSQPLEAAPPWKAGENHMHPSIEVLVGLTTAKDLRVIITFSITTLQTEIVEKTGPDFDGIL